MPRSRKLSDKKVRQILTDELPRWTLEDGRLCREFRFPDFTAAFAFMTRVALVAEAMGHHPDWCNAYDRVRVELITHEVGGITERDLRLAREMDRFAGDEA